MKTLTLFMRQQLCFMLTKYVELLSRLTSLLQSVMESSEIATGVTKCYVDYSSTEKERVRFEQKFLVLLQF